MFIRTKRRRSKKSRPDGHGIYRDDWACTGLLLGVDDQNALRAASAVIAYLGSIEERLMSLDRQRALFHKNAMPKLESVTQPDQYESLIQSLKAKVPQPD